MTDYLDDIITDFENDEHPYPEPPGTFVGNVTIHYRTNQDKSLTIYMRWNIRRKDDGRWLPRNERLFRTEPAPTKASKRDWLRQARSHAAERQRELADPERARKQRSRRIFTLDKARDMFATWICGDDWHASPVAESTVTARLRVLDSFIAFVAETYPDTRTIWQLSHRHTANWREHRRAIGIADSSLSCECSHLQAFLDFCDRHEWMRTPLRAMPREYRRRLHTRRRPPPAISTKEIREIIRDQKVPHRRDMIRMLAATGVRQGELRSLRMKDWNLDSAVLTVPEGKHERTKLHGRQLPIGPWLARVLNEYARDQQEELLIFAREDGRAWGGSDMNRWLRPSGYRPHDLRRWFYTMLLDSGCPPHYAKLLMGHALSQTEGPYIVGWGPEKARAWMHKLDSLVRV